MNVRRIVKASVAAVVLPALATLGLWGATSVPAAAVPSAPSPTGIHKVPTNPAGTGNPDGDQGGAAPTPSPTGPQQCATCAAPSGPAGPR